MWSRPKSGPRSPRVTPSTVSAMLPPWRMSRIFCRLSSAAIVAPPMSCCRCYDELRRLAARRLVQERPGQTLQATALVHEAYMRLVASGANPFLESLNPENPATATPALLSSAHRRRGDATHIHRECPPPKCPPTRCRRQAIEPRTRSLASSRRTGLAGGAGHCLSRFADAHDSRNDLCRSPRTPGSRTRRASRCRLR